MPNPVKLIEEFLARGQAAQAAVDRVLDAAKVKAKDDGAALLSEGCTRPEGCRPEETGR
jgi:hypothetical protein